MKCVYCRKVLNTKKDNYGWHCNLKGEIEKCYFQNMPMQVITKPFKLKKNVY